MSAVRKVQRVGYSTLTVSIPSEYVKDLGLQEGDHVEVKEEADGTLRVIPTVRNVRTVKATIRTDLVADEELLSKLMVSCYMLGYDTIELTAKEGGRRSFFLEGSKMVRRLRGVEVVESSESKMVAQSFMDPTKFPVDSLIKRLRLLVSKSLADSVQALRTGSPALVNGIRRNQDEIDELYWLIVRQLLVALSDREISSKIGLESPLHTSGDRVTAKTLEEMGRMVLELTEEIVNFKETGVEPDVRALRRIEGLAKMAQASFEETMESFLAPEIRTIERAMETSEKTIRLEREVMFELQESEYPYMRAITSDLGQVARYCNIINEISLNRLLRKTSRVCSVQTQ